MTAQIFVDTGTDRQFRASVWTGRSAIYLALLVWAFICLFPIFWTVTTSFKSAPDVMKGNMIPWAEFTPKWLGWKKLGLSPDTIFEFSSARAEFLRRFMNSVIISVSASALAVGLGTIAAYGLSRFEYRFLAFRNADISFFFLSQLIMPPVVMALPFLALYKELDLLDTRVGLIAVYALSVLPIVVWIMRDQFEAIPTELEEAAMVDGLSIWGAFLTIVLPIALPGMVAAGILCLVLTWNEYFFAILLTSTEANTLPVMVASKTGSQGIEWWTMAAISFASILPLIVVGVLLEKYIIMGMSAGAVK
jgi:multiple sugar transport system permease protein